jgi:hypothetical protein
MWLPRNLLSILHSDPSLDGLLVNWDLKGPGQGWVALLMGRGILLMGGRRRKGRNM